MSERSLLADAVETFFTDRFPHETVVAVERGENPRALWDETAQLGLTLSSVPELAGGGGGTLVDAMTVLRAAGRHAVPLPLAETDVLAGWLLSEAGLDVPAGPLAVAPARPGDMLKLDAAGRLSGRAGSVAWGRWASRIVVLGADPGGAASVALVDPDQVAEIRPGTSLAGEPRDELHFAGASCVHVVPVRMTIDDLLVRGALARSVLMVGALEAVRDLTVSYAREREQFGRPIAAFQAVQHMLAEIARDVAVVRAAVELAVTAVEEGGSAAWLEVACAKVLAGRAALDVGARAHQVHGAIGVTTEYPLSVLTRRLWSWRDEHGTDGEWAARIGRAGSAGAWALVSAGRIPVGTVRTA